MVGIADIFFARACIMPVLLPHLLTLAFEALVGPPRCIAGLAWTFILVGFSLYWERHDISLLSVLGVLAGISCSARFPRASRDDGAVAARSARRAGALLTAFCFDYYVYSNNSFVLRLDQLLNVKSVALYCVTWLVWRLRELTALKLRRATSDSFVARTQLFSGILAFLNAWRTLLLIFFHSLWLSARLRDMLEDMGPTAPTHAYGVQTVVDRIRALLSVAIRQIAAAFVSLATAIGPRGSTWYLAPMPMPDIPNVEYGLALFAKGDLVSEPASAITLNVGHLDVFPGVDTLHTAKATAEMLQDLASTKVPGFVANLVCFLPDTDTGRLREINLSAWHNSKAAHDWYTTSTVHKTIVSDYYNRRMSSFSSVLATYKTDRPPRFHARCPFCFELQTYYRENPTCPRCNRPVSMPLF